MLMVKLFAVEVWGCGKTRGGKRGAHPDQHILGGVGKFVAMQQQYRPTIGSTGDLRLIHF